MTKLTIRDDVSKTPTVELFLEKGTRGVIHLRATDPDHPTPWKLLKISPDGVTFIGGLPDDFGIKTDPDGTLVCLDDE